MAVITGTSGNDTIVGTSTSDSLSGADGNDSIAGGAGNDTLRGNAGTDWIEGGTGNDDLGGGGGQDSFVLRQMGTANADLLFDFATGWDNLQLDAAAFTNLGAAGRFSSGDARFRTGTAAQDADDRIIFNSATGQLFYDADGNGAGAQQLIATLPSGRTVTASDFWVFGTPPSGGGVIRGTDGNDSLTGTSGNDSMEGLAGNDTLNGGAGADTMHGGLHDDVFIVDNAGDVVVELEGGGSFDLVQSSVSYTLPAWVNDLTLTGTLGINGTGNELANRIIGNAGGNALVGHEGDDTLEGQGGSDWLEGGAGNDSLLGGDGQDSALLDGLGQDFIDGGTSDLDSVHVLFDLTDVVIDLAAGTASWGGASAGSAQLANLENVYGSNQADRVTGNALANTLTGYGGNDSLAGGAGDDTLWGVDGDDTLDGGADWDWVVGGAGNDSLLGGSGVDSLRGEAGNDTLLGGDDTDWFWFENGYGFDLVDGGAGADVVIFTNGFAQSSIVIDLADGTMTGGGAGGTGQATLVSIEHAGGGSFADHIVGNAQDNSVSGNDGDDLVEGAGGHDTVTGEAGNDTLLGGAGNDYVHGQDGVNWIEGGSGNDTLLGGLQADSYAFRDAPGFANADQVIDNDFTSGLDKLVLDATAHANAGASGNFSAGDARFVAGTGLTSGQDASDRVIYDTSTGQLWYDADGSGSGASQLIATLFRAPSLAATDIAILNGSEPGGITRVGTAGNDSLTGGSGNDTLLGLAGSDTLDGAEGADSMEGGLHNDVYIVDDAGDLVVESEDGGSNDEVRSSVSYALPDWVNDLVLTGNAAIGGAGNGLANILQGNDAGNTLAGGSGSDTIIGGAGNDTLDGEGGPEDIHPSGKIAVDTLNGGLGDDSYYVTGGDLLIDAGGTDTVILGYEQGTWTLGAGFENLVLSTIVEQASGFGNDLDNIIDGASNSRVLIEGRGGNDTLIGSGASDRLFGGDGNDVLRGNGSGSAADLLDGGAGNDQLTASDFAGNADFHGGAGNDTLNGGGGSDRFFFTEAPGSANADVINNFSSGTDDIVLDGNAHASAGASGRFAAGDARFRAGTSAQDADDRVIFNAATGQLWYDADGNGGGAQQLIATVQGAVAATDIEILNGTSGTITGTPGNDSLTGTSGNDTIDGGAGNDTMNGLGGNDTYYVNPGDVIQDSGGIDTLFATASFALPSPIEHITYLGSNNTSSVGNSLANAMTGNSGRNYMEGRGGNDTLAGGTGIDTLNGGAGNDVFVFSEMGTANADAINGFLGSEDDLAFDDAVFAGLGGAGSFRSGAGLSSGQDADDRLIYNTSTGQLYYDADGSGSGGSQLVATLGGAPGLTASDITIV